MTTQATGALMIRGTVFFDILIDGVAQGLKEVRGVIECLITPKSKTINQVSKDKDTAGQVTASVTTADPTELKLKFSAFNKLMMAIALMGESSLLNTGASTVTAEAMLAKLDCFIELSLGNIVEGSVVVTNTAGTTTYLPGVDYTVNYAVGMVQALSSGAITQGQALKVSFATAALSGFITRGATTPSVKGRIIIDGKNLADGDSIKIEIDMAQLATTSPVDFMSDKISELELSGFMLTLPGKADPYRVTKCKAA